MRRFDRFFQMLIEALAIAAGAILAAITLALAINVALRVLFDSVLYGMVDAIEFGLMAATFLAAPWVLNKNAHVAVDIVQTALPDRAGRMLDATVSVFGAVLSIIFAYASFSALLIAFGRGSMMRGVLVVPEWLPLVAPSLAGVLLAVEFLRRLARAPSGERQQTGL